MIQAYVLKIIMSYVLFTLEGHLSLLVTAFYYVL